MSKPSRRRFLEAAASATLMKCLGHQQRGWLLAESQTAGQKGELIKARDFLAGILNTREGTGRLIKGTGHIRYHPELGWVLCSYRAENDGIDGSTTTCTVGQRGERITINHSDKKCRINTYGNSFTQCSQVNDGETWQEYLAAHLCEPVRNFGVGGYSVYQAYLRMQREEALHPAPFIIFNIYDDDHYRNLEPWWSIRWGRHPGGSGMPVPHLKYDPATETFTEVPNPCPTPDSLYNLCDLDWVEARFKDDFVLKIMLEHINAREANPGSRYKDLMEQDKTLGIVTGINRGKTISKAAEERHSRTALLASIRVVEMVEWFARKTGKTVLYVLSFNSASIAHRVETGVRTDQLFVDFLNERELPYVDLLVAHLADFGRSKEDIEDYLARYYIRFYTGHYSPRGNFFTAFTIKDKVKDLLIPKPASYPV